MALQRMKDVTVERGIVYGSEAVLAKQDASGNIYRWRCYIRGPRHEDISYFVSRVTFELHPSFQNPIRHVDQPPFELWESGWGEFEIKITVHFVDPNEKPVDIYHMLRLFPPEGAPPNASTQPVISECYDYIVFQEPTEQFYNILAAHPPDTSGPPMYTPYDASTAATAWEQAEIDKIQQAQLMVRAEVRNLKTKYDALQRKALALRKKIDQLEEREAKLSRKK